MNGNDFFKKIKTGSIAKNTREPIKIVSERKKEGKAKIITVASLKGGVGKTSIAANLGFALTRHGYKTLLIDVDPNNNLTDYLLRDNDFDKIWQSNVFHALVENKSFEDCIHQGLFSDVLPATIELQKVGTELASDPGSILRFRTELKNLSYDFIVIDTPPSTTFEFRAGIYSADTILTPLAPVRWNLQAITILVEEIDRIEKTFGKRPNLLGIPSMITKNQNLQLKGMGLVTLTETGILKASEIYTAQNNGKTLKENSKSLQRFTELAMEVA